MRDFLKYTFASLVGSLLGLVLLSSLGIGGLIFLIIAASSQESGPKIEDKSVLVFDLSTEIRDTKPSSSTSQAIQEALSDEESDSITLRTVLDSLDQATKDKRIVALYLQGSSNGNSNGLATLREVREALEKFRAAGKQIIAYDDDWTEGEYYLASVANKVVVNPLGTMELNGFSSQTMFVTGALNKYGVGVQVVRVGKYKAAVEPVERTQMSPENKQQTQKFLNDFWGEFRTSVGKNRQLTPNQIQTLADTQGLFMPKEAQQRKLVDKVAYFDEVVAELKKLGGTDKEDKTFRQINLTTYAKANETRKELTNNSKNTIAIVYAEGEIVDGQGGVTEVGGDRLAKQLRQLRLDKDVKAVVLRVNSPGGSATASEVIQREVKLTRKEKPIVVSMGNVAASGGYWISTDADRIFAEPTTITGSIGVFGMLLNVQQLANNNGITWDVVKTARYADSRTNARPKTEQELAVYRKMVQQVYDQFLTKVAESRKIPKQTVNEIAQGRVWSGLEAKRIGLVDQMGGIQDAIAEAAKLAKLGDKWQVEEYPKTRTFEQRIVQKLIGAHISSTPVKPDPLTLEWKKLQQELTIFTSLNDPRGIYARLPYNFRIE
ncbi:signal peptide peptidase SppA [Microcoleus sp. FACHB-672]|uniref:signal peptide peptidase SppA n=1 Tax=Microcoleus sp. FACHB-672 TaxID=2692825 RepID=UPI001685A1D3|nr:signal peptide peptidase SppA [Microcoleus sp. FACHB-672]MBD2042574.1 signal peptide peptidase SppA [Microcoleus sp. FACHB-672]